MAELFAGKEWQTFLQILPTIPFETWETVWSTVVATLLALVIGLPLGVLLVITRKDHILPHPTFNMVLGFFVNLLRSVPFIILLVMLFPVTRAVMGSAIGTVPIIAGDISISCFRKVCVFP